MEKKLTELITKHYKTATVYSINLEDGVVYIYASVIGKTKPFIARRILNAYPEIRRVEFVGFTKHIFSRDTLSWLGYNTKK